MKSFCLKKYDKNKRFYFCILTFEKFYLRYNAFAWKKWTCTPVYTFSTYRCFEKTCGNHNIIFQSPPNRSQKVGVHIFHHLLFPGDLYLFWIPPRRRARNFSRSHRPGWRLSFHKVPANLLPSNPWLGGLFGHFMTLN